MLYAPIQVGRNRIPADQVQATEQALATLKTSHGDAFSAVKGIGFSGQMYGATLLDMADQALLACILWNDTRSHKQADPLEADPRFRPIIGNIVFPGFTVPKLVWV